MPAVAQRLANAVDGLDLDGLVFDLRAGRAAVGHHQGSAHHGPANQEWGASRQGSGCSDGAQKKGDATGGMKCHAGFRFRWRGFAASAQAASLRVFEGAERA